ncbi:hypothetical protein MSAN_02393600 [Mycena sanguinolenta]|uniref:Uncharacterized protein n=1 Tax=Mycena sanguinolenta TaxID=230812 RepID=A0A8H7CG76_9AGAR|nr:hypothetical protein MSAN_02393600 [Mycena sanguinolenta]
MEISVPKVDCDVRSRCVVSIRIEEIITNAFWIARWSLARNRKMDVHGTVTCQATAHPFQGSVELLYRNLVFFVLSMISIRQKAQEFCTIRQVVKGMRDSNVYIFNLIYAAGYRTYFNIPMYTVAPFRRCTWLNTAYSWN